MMRRRSATVMPEGPPFIWTKVRNSSQATINWRIGNRDCELIWARPLASMDNSPKVNDNSLWRRPVLYPYILLSASGSGLNPGKFPQHWLLVTMPLPFRPASHPTALSSLALRRKENYLCSALSEPALIELVRPRQFINYAKSTT